MLRPRFYSVLTFSFCFLFLLGIIAVRILFPQLWANSQVAPLVRMTEAEQNLSTTSVRAVIEASSLPSATLLPSTQ